MKHFAAFGLNALILGLVIVAGIIGWGVNSFRGEGPLSAPTVVEVPRGAGLDTIAARLAEAGAITNPAVFRVGVRYLGVAADLKFGVYEIPPGASMQAIAMQLAEGGADARFRVSFVIGQRGVSLSLRDLLRSDEEAVRGTVDQAAPAEAIAAALEAGSSVSFRVTVPEGLTSFQVVEGLRAIEHLSGEIAELPAEGSLAPDTYAFRRGADRQGLIDEMVAAQTRTLAAAWEARQPGLPLESPEEALILASIVEKETGQPEERPMVASVFINRIRRGMPLQTDPTIIYGITRGRELFEREISRSDIRGVTERRQHGGILFNTYQIPGLPPTPIANPGRAAIEATLKPADTPYLFFVADGTGGHAFAETNREHEANRARIEAERRAQ